MRRERGEGEQGDGGNDVFQPSGQAVVQIDKAAGNNAEYEGHGELGFAYLQDGGGGGEDAGENGQRGDEE